MAEQPAQQTADGPGRYQRSIGGGIGAMAVLVVCVLAFVGLRSCTRDNAEVTPEAVDYLSAVGQAQSAGLAVVYPPSLPHGWTATSIDFVPGKRPAWGIGMLTDDEKFVGIRQADDDLSSLLATYVDADAVQGDTVTVPGALDRAVAGVVRRRRRPCLLGVAGRHRGAGLRLARRPRTC